MRLFVYLRAVTHLKLVQHPMTWLRSPTPVPPSRTLTNTPLGSGSTWFTRMYIHGTGSNPNTPAHIFTVCTGHAHIYFRWLRPIMWKHRLDLRLRWVLNDNRAWQMTEESDRGSAEKTGGVEGDEEIKKWNTGKEILVSLKVRSFYIGYNNFWHRYSEV